MIPRRVAQFGRKIYPHGLWEGPNDRPWVAITFDDGPDPEMTPRTLEALERADAPATFFVVGSRAARRPELLHRIRDAGHEIGNHTWEHRPLSFGAWGSPEWQLARTEEVLAKHCPGSLRIFRPPFGAIGPGGRGALSRHGLLPIYWSVVPADWDPLAPEVVARRVLQELHSGAVIVLHAGRPWHAGTAAAIEGLVESVRERGYEIVPLARMLEAGGFAVGRR